MDVWHKKVVYRADFTNKANNDQQFYFDLAETTFKERYINHKRDIKHIKYRKVLFQACNFVTKRKTRSKNIVWSKIPMSFGKYRRNISFTSFRFISILFQTMFSLLVVLFVISNVSINYINKVQLEFKT